MPPCELCGKDTQLIAAIVEGTQLNTCQGCGKFGKILRRPVAPKPVVKLEKKEPVEVVTGNYAALIRTAREKAGMTQKDFAKLLNEKESVLQKVENGAFTPPISMARKLEKLLKIKLVEIEEEEKTSSQAKKSGPLTIGDILKIRK